MKLPNLLSEDSNGIEAGSVINVEGQHLTVMNARMGKGGFDTLFRRPALDLKPQQKEEDCLLVLVRGNTRGGGFIIAFRMQEGIGGRLSLDLTKLWSGTNPYNGPTLPNNLGTLGFWMESDVEEIL
jgi:hypothetical protein